MKSIYFIAVLISLTGAQMAQSIATDRENLKTRIIEELKAVKGEHAVAFRNLNDTLDQIFINEQKVFHAASTMKTAVMIEAFRQDNEGILSLDDSILVRNEFKSIADSSLYSMELDRDSGESLYETLGKKLTLRQLIYDMITVSSNLATNLIIDIIGAKNVQNTIDEIGVKHMKVLRGVEDIKAFDKGLNNVTTAFDLMLLFEQIATEKIVSEKACKEMTSILLDQKFNKMIPAGLPSDIKVAHKTGSITGIQHDSGFIILPDGRKYILVILWSQLEDNAKAIITSAKISEMIYNYLIKI